MGLDPLTIAAITVPDGKTLQFDCLSVTGSSIDVDGKIVLSPTCDAGGITISVMTTVMAKYVRVPHGVY